MRKMVLMVLLVIGLSAFTGGTALAFDETEKKGCTTTMLQCFEEAARIDSFWYRTAAALDCELDFIECARIKIMGS
jgi:hypothetical protein